MIDGVKLKIGDKEFIFPPMNLRISKRFEMGGGIKAFAESPDAPGAEVDGMARLIHATLERNYPDLTLDEVEEMVNVKNAGAIINAVLGISGFSAGEAPANP